MQSEIFVHQDQFLVSRQMHSILLFYNNAIVHINLLVLIINIMTYKLNFWYSIQIVMQKFLITLFLIILLSDDLSYTYFCHLHDDKIFQLLGSYVKMNVRCQSKSFVFFILRLLTFNIFSVKNKLSDMLTYYLWREHVIQSFSQTTGILSE